jgi:hypothetical protein
MSYSVRHNFSHEFSASDKASLAWALDLKQLFHNTRCKLKQAEDSKANLSACTCLVLSADGALEASLPSEKLPEKGFEFSLSPEFICTRLDLSGPGTAHRDNKYLIFASLAVADHVEFPF